MDRRSRHPGNLGTGERRNNNITVLFLGFPSGRRRSFVFPGDDRLISHVFEQVATRLLYCFFFVHIFLIWHRWLFFRNVGVVREIVALYLFSSHLCGKDAPCTLLSHSLTGRLLECALSRPSFSSAPTTKKKSQQSIEMHAEVHERAATPFQVCQ